MQHTVKKIFDECADHYATERERLPYFRAQIKIMLSMLSGQTGETILDIGCAAGAEIPSLRALGFKVIGVDFSERMLQFCEARFEGDDQVALLCVDAEHIPLSQNSVDHVVCLGLFEFLNDYSLAITEISRVLRPSGLAVFAIPSRISLYNLSYRFVDATLGKLWRIAKRILGRKPPSPFEHRVRRNLCIPWRFRKLLREHGFHPERSAYSNFFIYPLDRFPQLDRKVSALLEPLASVPLLRMGASVYLVSARKNET